MPKNSKPLVLDLSEVGAGDVQLVGGKCASLGELFRALDGAVERMVTLAIEAAPRAGKKIGICGQAPSDYPEFARFLVEKGISSISLNPDTVLQTTHIILEAEAELPSRPSLQPHLEAKTAPATSSSAVVPAAFSETGVG